MLPLCFVFFSCATPLDLSVINNVKDKIKPEIIIQSPAEDVFCTNIAEIKRKITDFATTNGEKGKIQSLVNQIIDTNLHNNINVNTDGSFCFQFITQKLPANFTLQIEATDWNSNQTIRLLPLQRELNNGIPSFKVIPGNRQAILQWNEIPNALSYTIYYSADDTLPVEGHSNNIDNAKSPCTLNDLDNSHLHLFRIKANPEPG